MILCALSTSISHEQRTKRRRSSENMWKVCLFYSQNNKIVWLSNVADTFWGKFTRCAKVCGFFFSTAFRMLIGWAGKLQTHGVLSLACGAWAPSGGSCPCPRLSERKAPGAHACAWGTCKYGYHAYRAGIVTILCNWLLNKSLPSSLQNVDDTRSSFVRALGILRHVTSRSINTRIQVKALFGSLLTSHF